MKLDRVIIGDCRAVLPTLDAESVQTVVTSPPYWGLRDYGHEGQIGLETTPGAYVASLVETFREVRRVLREDGTLWLNLGDSYAGSRQGPQGETGAMADRSVAKQRRRTRPGNPEKNGGASNRDGCGAVPGAKPKDLIGIPWTVALALRADGWYLRADIIWAKPNPMPESVRDRPTKAHEYVFLLSKSERYFYDADAIREAHSHPELARKAPPSPNAGRTADYQRESGRNDGGQHVSGPGFRSDPDIGRNARSVWALPSQPYRGSHFATMPPALAERCILAGSRPGDLVLDPFIGSGTVGEAAERLGRRWLGIDLGYAELSEKRTAQRGIRWA